MTPARAKEVLEGMGLIRFDSGYLYRTRTDGFGYFRASAGGEKVDIDGQFTREELQAIALWMQDPEGVTNA